MRKGITPIIAIIILLLITLSLAASAWLFLGGYAGTMSSGILLISSVYESDGQAVAYATNIGSSVLTADDIVLMGDGEEISFELNSEQVQPGDSFTITFPLDSPKQLQAITASISTPFTCGVCITEGCGIYNFEATNDDEKVYLSWTPVGDDCAGASYEVSISPDPSRVPYEDYSTTTESSMNIPIDELEALFGLGLGNTWSFAVEISPVAGALGLSGDDDGATTALNLVPEGINEPLMCKDVFFATSSYPHLSDNCDEFYPIIDILYGVSAETNITEGQYGHGRKYGYLAVDGYHTNTGTPRYETYIYEDPHDIVAVGAGKQVRSCHFPEQIIYIECCTTHTDHTQCDPENIIEREIYLPEQTSSGQLYTGNVTRFYAADDGSTYWYDSSHDGMGEKMDYIEAMDESNTHLARENPYNLTLCEQPFCLDGNYLCHYPEYGNICLNDTIICDIFCPNGCLGSECIGTTGDCNVTLNDTCAGDFRLYAFSCDEEQCSYETEYCDYGCSAGDGTCLQSADEYNLKDMTKYDPIDVFLISDKEWKDVLQLVPLTTWSGDEWTWEGDGCNTGYGTPDFVCAYPTLVYHEEEDAFDADSIIHFLQQYGANSLTIWTHSPDSFESACSDGYDNDRDGVTDSNDVDCRLLSLLNAQPDFGAGISYSNIEIKDFGEEEGEAVTMSSVAASASQEDYLSYWQSNKEVVFVEDDYGLALEASVYAAIKNAPLVIEGSALDKASTYRYKDVICVLSGPDSASPYGDECDQVYDLDELRQEYLDETYFNDGFDTDKIVLVNPNDLEISFEDSFYPEKSANAINDTYSKASLSAPFIASAKRQILLHTNYTNYENVDQFIEDTVSAIGMYPQYLTVVASPIAIDMSWQDRAEYKETDNRVYGNLDDDYILDMGSGRVFGISVADASSNIARSLFYDDIAPDKSAVSVIYKRSDPPGDDPELCEEFARDNYYGNAVRASFDSAYEYGGSDTRNHIAEIMGQLANSRMFVYNDHGIYDQWSYYLSKSYVPDNKYPQMEPVVIFNEACYTCSFKSMLNWHYKTVDMFSDYPMFPDLNLDQTPLEIFVSKPGRFYSTYDETVEMFISADGDSWTSCGSFTHPEYPDYNLTFDCGPFTAQNLFMRIDVEGGRKTNVYSRITLTNAQTGETVADKEGSRLAHPAWYHVSNMFCSQMIRKGAVIFHGATDQTYGHGEELDYLTSGVFVDGMSVGESIKLIRNTYDYGPYSIYPTEIIIGDPTFKAME